MPAKKKTRAKKTASKRRKQENLLAPKLERLPLEAFTEKAYLDYSMYVILDRALPSIADGLKPVQRRIIYAMSDLGLHAAAKYKKSARSVGDVLGKFHPHGDTACYEAMVLMAQSFSYRYPLIDGQGNWGSQDDPKSFAAMRYTESRLTQYAQLLLDELEQGTAEWAPNFDGTLLEPKLLPARLPNVLLNGGSGIAVGMATDIPPHNLREVTNACVHLLQHPKAGLAELCEHILGPDFPTPGEIISSREEIRAIYASGAGSVRQRAAWQKEGGDIVITALPYQVSGARVQEQIAAQMHEKKLPMVSDLRDESDHENPTRLVIEPRSNRVDLDAMMQHLFATTDLERSYRVNLNLIGLNRRPRVFDLKSLLVEWLAYRMQTVTKRLQHRLEKITERLHIVDGLLIIFPNINEVIRIIRNNDEPAPALMKKFKISALQAEAILELKLRRLAKLEEMKLRAERDKLAEESKHLQAVLKSKPKLKRLMRDELLADAKLFGDARRSPIVVREAAKALDEKSLMPTEPLSVIASKMGWVRAAKGHEIDGEKLGYKSGDELLQVVRGKTNDILLTLDSDGRAYSLAPHKLPSARGFGEPLSSHCNTRPDASFCGMMFGDATSEVLLATSAGYGFVAKLGDLVARGKNGKAVLRVPPGATALLPQAVGDFEDDWLGIATNVGRFLIFALGELPHLARGKGVKLTNIPAAKFKSGEEKATAVCVFKEGQRLRIHSGKHYLNLKPADFEHYVGNRAARGRMLPKQYRKPHLIEAVEK